MKTIIKQTYQQLKEQPLISIVSIAGTALSLFLIMLVVMMQQVKVAPFSPESNRDRMLHVKFGSVKTKDGESNGPMSLYMINAVYKKMKTPEAVTIYTFYSTRQPLSANGKKSFTADVKLTDATFWHVFDFEYIYGKPYNEADFKAGISLAVISRSTARRLFNTTGNVVGSTFMLQHIPYKVAAVVNDVSTLATMSYSQIWIPYTTDQEICNSVWNNVMGEFSTTILMHSPKDEAKVHAEAVANVNKFNLTIKDNGIKILNRNRPYNTEKGAISFGANIEPDVSAAHRTQLIVFLILLIVPAINLSSMTHSRLRQRISEIGIRRAFGCTQWSIASQIITENMIVTLCAGALGLLMSITCGYCFNELLFTPEVSFSYNNPPIVNTSILIHMSTFIYALAFCFVLNLLSTGIPAWQACKTSIINDLNGRR
ncbi:ABC-type antimicrobial peptide transport system, permease component [Xylanibacter oryzae DSM 17970]|uniref:ABC-type antimicrobial peptide transport system, permease component n=1 Tax=Xylanibacter oryzae DSM 17970 TaxID=915438 RepID=A0ABN0RTZ3_9BACT|nr:ABC transporter permease [Xylanibacter oryzae]EXG77706.1 ABC-type antimicrobial peptide transport system, permease component [Xylanibacter oryzae DSM 17970]HRN15742.1 ABC transporter permease [Xylanibacter oryzae]